MFILLLTYRGIRVQFFFTITVNQQDEHFFWISYNQTRFRTIYGALVMVDSPWNKVLALWWTLKLFKCSTLLSNHYLYPSHFISLFYLLISSLTPAINVKIIVIHLFSETSSMLPRNNIRNWTSKNICIKIHHAAEHQNWSKFSLPHAQNIRKYMTSASRICNLFMFRIYSN